jgi:hypothetical protein
MVVWINRKFLLPGWAMVWAALFCLILILSAQFDKWNIKPAVGLSYFEETKKAYTDINGFRIGKQTLELGSLSFGPTVTYAIKGKDNTIIKPMVGLKGIWDFDSPDIYDGIGTSDFESHTGELSMVMPLKLSGIPEGATLQASYVQSGLNLSENKDYNAKLLMKIPLD